MLRLSHKMHHNSPGHTFERAGGAHPYSMCWFANKGGKIIECNNKRPYFHNWLVCKCCQNCLSNTLYRHEHTACVNMALRLWAGAHANSLVSKFSSAITLKERLYTGVWFCMPSCSRLSVSAAWTFLRPLATSVRLNPDGALKVFDVRGGDIISAQVIGAGWWRRQSWKELKSTCDPFMCVLTRLKMHELQRTGTGTNPPPFIVNKDTEDTPLFMSGCCFCLFPSYLLPCQISSPSLPKLMHSTFSGEAMWGKQQVMKYLAPLYVWAVGHIEPFDSRTPTPGDVHTLKMLTTPRDFPGVSADSCEGKRKNGEGSCVMTHTVTESHIEVGETQILNI